MMHSPSQLTVHLFGIRLEEGGRGESRDPATNLTPPKREINSGILDNPQSPVNQNQTQQNDVSPISIKPNKPNPQWKRKCTAESARPENGKKICPESRESPVITPVREEEDNIPSTSEAPPDGNQIIPRETFGNGFSNPPNIENFDFTNNDQSPEKKTTKNQKSSSTRCISMVSADADRATNNQANSPVQRTEEPTSTVHVQREMSAAQRKEELKIKMNELKTEIDKSNSEEVEMSAA
ncbi:hypothetical protein RRG08_026938 [Elysia crispata]|uniref:Uncharacterized protein n=1 Tax=Elysia crispata TaxID=231223 RepID=A0AAE0YQS3_9GAST|nr:hypothetical protein RRG08_026938 [Elysia crispata]